MEQAKGTRTEARQFPCKQCGASLTFAPGTRELVCPYCGFRDTIPTTPEAIAEYDLDEAFLRLPRTEGWGTQTRSLHCSNCGATTVFAAGQTAGRCAFCGSGKVVEQETREGVIRPESIVPFRVERATATQRFQEWLGRLWFRPNDLKRLGRLEGMNGAYLPFWTFDAYTSSHWTADAGYYYYETEQYHETDAQGNTVTKTREVQKVRWEPAAGYHEEFFDDVLVCASRGVPEGLVNDVGAYDLGDLTPYDASFLAGFLAEEYQVDLREGWERGRERIQDAVNAACASEVPGDTQRNLHVNTAFSQMRFRHTLMPLWVAAYEYRGRSFRFLVNGQTGEVRGEAPLSPWKIAFAVLATLLIFLVLYLIFGHATPQ